MIVLETGLPKILPRFVRGLVIAFGLFASTSALSAQEARVVSGIVVDSETGAPVADATVSVSVSVSGADLFETVLTDDEGRFEIEAVPLGDQQLVLRHVAYGEHTETLVVGPSESLEFRIVVSTQAIELEPLEVEVSSTERAARRAFGTATTLIDRETIEAFPPSGEGLLPLLQARVPGLRVENQCVEYRFQQHLAMIDAEDPERSFVTPCRDVTVYVDGMPRPLGSEALRQLQLQDVESLRLLSPAEAGVQYMGGNRGVLLVELRQGVVQDTPYRVHLNGFGWEEPESYPWFRTLGGSALGNALVVGLATNTLLDCEEREAWPDPARCGGMAGMSAALLTGAVAPVIARFVGRTAYSEGRTYPTLLTALATASAGYLLYTHGEREGSDAHRTAGRVVLAVGVPVTMTFANRLFRMLR